MKTITPLQHIDCQITVPGSKSLTQRALIAAALADGESTLVGPLTSEDTEYTSAALRAMGIEVDTSGPEWRGEGPSGRNAHPDAAQLLVSHT